MARAKIALSKEDVACASDSYPRKGQRGHCGQKFTVYTPEQAHGLCTVGCINCAREKMRADALRDRRPLRDTGRRGR